VWSVYPASSNHLSRDEPRGSWLMDVDGGFSRMTGVGKKPRLKASVTRSFGLGGVGGSSGLGGS
jgi:hypothetical protein